MTFIQFFDKQNFGKNCYFCSSLNRMQMTTLPHHLMNTVITQKYTVTESMLNINGTLFGGEAMGWMDQVGHEVATCITIKKMYTFTADKIKFIKPVFLNETVEVTGEPIELGAVKLSVKVTIIADPNGPNRRTALTGIFTFVQLNEEHQPEMIEYISRENCGFC